MSSGVAQKWLTPLREIPTGHVWMGKRWGGVLCCWLSPIWLIIVASFFERPLYRMMPFYDDQTLTGKALVVCLPIAISYYFGLNNIRPSTPAAAISFFRKDWKSWLAHESDVHPCQ
jgi:uncharacterized membrane protein